jgi:hypothetical protein
MLGLQARMYENHSECVLGVAVYKCSEMAATGDRKQKAPTAATGTTATTTSDYLEEFRT